MKSYTKVPTTKGEKARAGFIIFLFATIIYTIDFIANAIHSGLASDMTIGIWLYHIPSAFGHAALIAGIAWMLFYLPWTFIFRRWQPAAAIYCTALTLAQIFLLVDIFVFSLYRFHLNGFVFEMIAGGGTEIFVIDWRTFLSFGLLAIICGILPFLLARWTARRYYRRTRRIVAPILTILICCIVFSHIGNAVAAAQRITAVRRTTKALPYFYPLTANRLLARMGLFNFDEMDEMEATNKRAGINYPLEPITASDSTAGYNILYILIDSWNPRAYGEEATPNIASFAQRYGQFYSQHFSSSNGTAGSIYGIFFGLPYSYETDFSAAQISPVYIDRLIELGYDIRTYPSAIFTRPQFHEMIYRKVPDIRLRAEGATSFDRDNFITATFLDEIDSLSAGNKPFFAFMFYDLPHAISLPAEHRTRFQPSWDKPDYLALNNNIDPTPFFNLYRNCVYYDDSLIGQVLAKVEEKGLLDNTIIVITGDHGQEFNENKRNFWGHNGNYTKWQLQIPLVLYYPGVAAGDTVTHTTTHFDITPTVMGRWLGVTNPPGDYSLGYDLADTTRRYPFILGDDINYGFVFEDIITTTNHFGSMEVTDTDLNPIKRSQVGASRLNEAILKKNRFYK